MVDIIKLMINETDANLVGDKEKVKTIFHLRNLRACAFVDLLVYNPLLTIELFIGCAKRHERGGGP